MKKAIFALTALALLVLSACGAAPPENVLQIPAGIFPEAPPARPPLMDFSPKHWPASTPEVSADSLLTRDADDDALGEYWTLCWDLIYFLSGQLPEDCVVDDVDQLTESLWMVYGWRLEDVGVLEPFRISARVTAREADSVPPGQKSQWAFTLEEWEELESNPAWSATARYRILVSEMAGGLQQVLQTLGLDDPEFHRLGPWPRTEDGFYPTDLSYDAAAEAIGRHMSFSNLETAGLLTPREGKLWYRDFGASGFNYWPDRVEQQADGSLLSYEHYYDFLRRRHEFVVSVQLEELEDGSLRVSRWEPDNQALMEEYQPALPGCEPLAPAADLP